MSSEFLFEAGFEEIPADFLPHIREQLRSEFERRLQEHRLPCASVEVCYTLRRLVVRLAGLASQQGDREEVVLGPPRKAALDSAGQPTKAAQGFARSKGVDFAQCRVIHTEKGEYFGFARTIRGESAAAMLPAICTATLQSLSFPKSMRWGEGNVTYVRPVRWILALLDGAPLSVEFAGVVSGGATRIDRFAAQADAPVTGWDDYLARLRSCGICVDPAERRRMIEDELRHQATSAGGVLREDPQLLDTVSDLVESPLVVGGRFAEEFLELPPEILMTSMREHQKHFAVVDHGGGILPHFLAVAESPGTRTAELADNVRRGNERVLRARLDDARFFWHEDARHTLEERAAGLDHVLFQQDLGTYRHKTERLLTIIPKLAAWLPEVDLESALAAARLCKADLTTDMVKEFPSLQGIVGGLYARREGHAEKVWRAIYDHYLPVSLDDRLPATDEGGLITIADRLDTISGCLGLGLVPSGSRDPLGLRRLGLGAVRISSERKWHLPLRDAFSIALDAHSVRFGRTREEIVEDFGEFVDARLRFLFEPYGYDLVNAVIAGASKDVYDVRLRLDALKQVIGSQDFLSIAVAFKRIKNIIREQPRCQVSRELYRLEEEREMDTSFQRVREEALPLIAQGEYAGALQRIATLRPVVDRFFDKVLVMDPDRVVRSNRIGLLQQMAALLLSVADFAEIAVEERSK
ncbi:MAG: glycine--tRNA ligase subunit beta [Acidobacteriota bacterium]